MLVNPLDSARTFFKTSSVERFKEWAARPALERLVSSRQLVPRRGENE